MEYCNRQYCGSFKDERKIIDSDIVVTVLYVSCTLTDPEKLWFDYGKEKISNTFASPSCKGKIHREFQIFYLSSTPLQEVTRCLVIQVLVNLLHGKHVWHFKMQSKLFWHIAMFRNTSLKMLSSSYSFSASSFLRIMHQFIGDLK